MTKEMWFEVIGYAGSLLVLVSMLMTSVVKLRVINLIGSAVFTVYAILIGSYPTAFLNGCLVIINIVQLIRQQRTTGKNYEIQPISGGDGFSDWLLRKYGEDVRKCFPGLDTASLKATEGFAVFFDDQAAGILLGKTERGWTLLDRPAQRIRFTSEDDRRGKVQRGNQSILAAGDCTVYAAEKAISAI